MTLAVSIRMGLTKSTQTHTRVGRTTGWVPQRRPGHAGHRRRERVRSLPSSRRRGHLRPGNQVLGEEALKLNAGDCCLITFSGNGGKTPDANGDEADGKDETWVFYDRMLIDDELYQMWGQFAGGVRIIVVSDSCHSRSAIRDIPERELMSLVDRRQKGPPDLRYKGLAGAVMQMGMTVMAHNGTILVHIRQQRLPKRGKSSAD